MMRSDHRPPLRADQASLHFRRQLRSGMGYVLKNQGYDTIEDYRALGGATLTSWGTEDRVLFRPSDPPFSGIRGFSLAASDSIRSEGTWI